MKKLSKIDKSIVVVIVLIIIVAVNLVFEYNHVNDISMQNSFSYRNCTLISTDSRRSGKSTFYYGTFEKNNKEFEVQLEKYMYEDLELIQENNAKFDLIINKKLKRVLGISNLINN